MTTMNQFIPLQRKLDQSVSKVDGPAKIDGHFSKLQVKRPVSIISIFLHFNPTQNRGQDLTVKSKVNGHGGFIRVRLDGQK